MKKLMAILTAFSLFMPFANVKAIEITNCAVSNSCFVYTPGQEVNFYRNVEESKLNSRNAGLSTIILEDNGRGEQYVRTLVLSPFDTSVPYYERIESEPLTSIMKDHKSLINKDKYPWESARHNANNELEMEYISLNELVSVFGASEQGDGTYKIDAAKWGSLFGLAVTGNIDLENGDTLSLRSNKGFFTSTYDKTQNKVWVVEYTLNGNYDITDIIVKQVDMENQNAYGYLPVVYFDKTYDCTSRITQDDMACYSCEDEGYRWLKVGSQAETCTLVENVKSQGTCVTTVQTGIEDYILEFLGISLVCGLALIIVKKKDLFKAI